MKCIALPKNTTRMKLSPSIAELSTAAGSGGATGDIWVNNTRNGTGNICGIELPANTWFRCAEWLKKQFGWIRP